MTPHLVPGHEADDERSWWERNRSKLIAWIVIALAIAGAAYGIYCYAGAHPPKVHPAPTEAPAGAITPVPSAS